MSDKKDFSQLSYEDFKRLAQDETLNRYEKIGFPNSYREGYEKAIVADIVRKASNLTRKTQLVVDIGPGVSDVPGLLINLCKKQEHTLILVDSKEMLDQLPDENFIQKVPCYYPFECPEFIEKYINTIDVIISYSVFQYVFAEMNPFSFLDRSLSLLKHGGQMLLGDIPNISQRKRFFHSLEGISFHKEFMQTEEPPKIDFNNLEQDKIDDGVLLGIVTRYRNMGFHTYILPQANDLPLANRREDLLIIKP